MENTNNMHLCVELKERGMFYGAVEDSARVICTLMGYKPQLRKKGRIECGFPKTSLEKVESALKTANIDYRIWSKNVEKNNELECFSENHYMENHYEDYVQRFDSSTLISVQNNSSKSVDLGDNLEGKSDKQICEFVQGQGLTIESAMMDFHRKIQDMYINKGLLVDTLSFISSQTGNNALCLIQGLIIYRKQG